MSLLTLFAAEEPSGIGVLGIDPWAILAQATIFLLLFFIIKKFALEKIVKTLNERHHVIDQGVRLGIEMEKEKAELDAKVAAALRQARAEADKLLTGAQSEANDILKAAEAEAAKRQAEFLEETRKRVDLDVKKARQQLEADILQLVAEATEVIIGEKLDQQKDDALIRRALNGVER